MTSVAMVSVAKARVNNLLLLRGAARHWHWHWYWEKESMAEEVVASTYLLEALEKIERLLRDAYKAGKVVRQEIEIEIARLSYELIDAMDKSFRSRFRIVRRWSPSMSSSLSKLGDLKPRLDKLVLKLQQTCSASDSDHDSDSEIREGGGGDVLDRAREDLLLTSSVVVCIVGESGMEKTTLAARLFHDAQLRSALQGFCWLSMNQSSFWSTFFSINKDKDKEKRLIVVDGVDNADDWSLLSLNQRKFQSDRIIITTCSMEVARLAARTAPAVVYKISPLVHSDILTIFNNINHPADSDKVGKAIYDISGGSPLLAIILKRCLDESSAEKEKEKSLLRELASYMPHKGTARVLGVCYNRLSPTLKPCLLYLGHFPQEIHIEKLYLLLMAEKLISPKDSKIYLQSVKNVLQTFATNKLLQMKQDDVDDYCRLHDQVRNFCKFKASEDEFIEILDLKSPTRVWPNTRRLFIYLSTCREDNYSLDKFISRDTKRKIWSLIVGKVGYNKCAWPSDLKEFIQLRVLDFNGVDFRDQKFPTGLDRLVLLRYLSFRGCFLDELPSSLSKLTQLETLDLLVDDYHLMEKMVIPHKILTNMKRLVHLLLPRLYKSGRGGNGKSKLQLQLQALEKLEVLVNLDASACDLAGVSKLRNLKIVTMVPSGVEVLDYYPLMNYLGMLEKLQSVVVANNAFVGERKEIVISAAPHFPKLPTLKLQNLDSLENLRIQQGAMPELSTLEIHACPRLENIYHT